MPPKRQRNGSMSRSLAGPDLRAISRAHMFPTCCALAFPQFLGHQGFSPVLRTTGEAKAFQAAGQRDSVETSFQFVSCARSARRRVDAARVRRTACPLRVGRALQLRGRAGSMNLAAAYRQACRCAPPRAQLRSARLLRPRFRARARMVKRKARPYGFAVSPPACPSTGSPAPLAPRARVLRFVRGGRAESSTLQSCWGSPLLVLAPPSFRAAK